jgi:hypothetical protein
MRGFTALPNNLSVMRAVEVGMATDESRRAFTHFPRAVNAITSPAEFDYIDFEQQR